MMHMDLLASSLIYKADLLDKHMLRLPTLHFLVLLMQSCFVNCWSLGCSCTNLQVLELYRMQYDRPLIRSRNLTSQLHNMPTVEFMACNLQ